MKENGFSIPSFVLGVILGPMAESNLRRALETSSDLSLFFTRPISGILLLLAVLSLGYGLYNSRKNRKTDKSGDQPFHTAS